MNAFLTKLKSIWTTFVADFKERFVKWDTLHGIWMLPAAIVGVFAIIHLQYILQWAGICAILFLVVEGIWRLLSNPVKNDIKLDILKAQRFLRLGMPTETIEVPLPPQPVVTVDTPKAQAAPLAAPGAVTVTVTNGPAPTSAPNS